MEAIIFCGLQAAGKSSLFKETFFSTHVRISLDLLRTRHREKRLLELCLQTQQPFVVDNTNATRDERRHYIALSATAGFQIVGYYFQSKVDESLQRNCQRSESERVPDVAILSTAKKLQIPSLDEGFDRLFYVQIVNSQFCIERWQNED